jgi:hypothetical protein
LVIQPPWRMPHSFEWVSVRLPSTATPFVFTYGLTVTELWRASSLSEPRLLDRVGLPWVIDLHNEITRAGSMALRRSMISLGIARPGEPSSVRTSPPLHEPVLDQSVMDELATSATLRVRTFLTRELGVVMDDLEQLPQGGKPSDALLPLVRRFENEFGRGARLIPTIDRQTKSKRSWGLECETLLQRLAAELLFLYTERPAIKRCVLCDARFITREKRANCSWTLWDAKTDSELQRCSRAEVFDTWAHDETALTHHRRRKLLTERIRQERQKAGGNEKDPRVIKARKARDDYMDAHGRRRGRAQPVIPPALAVTPDTNSAPGKCEFDLPASIPVHPSRFG